MEIPIQLEKDREVIMYAEKEEDGGVIFAITDTWLGKRKYCITKLDIEQTKKLKEVL
jgi:hypothetical protein